MSTVSLASVAWMLSVAERGCSVRILNASAWAPNESQALNIFQAASLALVIYVN